MSHCSADDIAKLIRNIQNSVYTLGIEEARQCRRGKLLDVLHPEDHLPKRRVHQTILKNSTPTQMTKKPVQKTGN